MRLQMELEPLRISPISQKECFNFINKYHRHHKSPVGTIFQISAARGDNICGVACCGRPVSRILDNGLTIEVTRLCTVNGIGAKHTASKLYATCNRIAKEMGYSRVITYILISEKGTSLKAAGWKRKYVNSGGSWTTPSRTRVDKHPLEQKVLWEAP